MGCLLKNETMPEALHGVFINASCCASILHTKQNRDSQCLA